MAQYGTFRVKEKSGINYSDTSQETILRISKDAYPPANLGDDVESKQNQDKLWRGSSIASSFPNHCIVTYSKSGNTYLYDPSFPTKDEQGNIVAPKVNFNATAVDDAKEFSRNDTFINSYFISAAPYLYGSNITDNVANNIHVLTADYFGKAEDPERTLWLRMYVFNE